MSECVRLLLKEFSFRCIDWIQQCIERERALQGGEVDRVFPSAESFVVFWLPATRKEINTERSGEEDGEEKEGGGGGEGGG